ncbi:MAG: DUF998 domain-containing protein [Flavobacteriales bacterium]|jgi:hypothetical membrane protein|nr:DUF998 domain-containing protein [Flavobacteriales bacterium]MBT7480922.1 DUF998 domain-containing protein [Flavobacteriales bacterium]
MNHKQIKLLRRTFLIFCIALGILTPFYCWYQYPDFNPIHQPLSHFGIIEPTWLLWNSTLVLLSIGIFWNAYTALRYYFKKRRFRYPLKMLLLSSSVSLFLTGTIPMDFEIYHKIPAFLFFFTYNLFVFLFGLFRSLKYFRRGIFSMFIGLSMLLSLLLLPIFTKFPSYGVFEIVYFSLILIWNIYFLFTRIKEEGLKSNKKGS